MKKIKLIIYVFSFLLILSSCKSDDEPSSPGLVGTWKLIENQIDATVVITFNNPDSPIKKIIREQSLELTSGDYITTYNADSTYVTSGSFIRHVVELVTTETMAGEITTEMNEYDETITSEPYPTGNWELNDNKILIKPDDDPIDPDFGPAKDSESTILEFTESTLKLNTLVEIIDSDEESNSSFVVNLVSNSELERQ